MSIPVDVAALDTALKEFGAGYLVTVTADGTTKVVTVEPSLDGGLLVIADPGNGSRANVAERPQVTLVLPPREERGFTLLVDGTAAVDGTDVRVTPTWAVLHRPAAHADGPPAPASLRPTAPTDCGNDCRPVGSRAADPA